MRFCALHFKHLIASQARRYARAQLHAQYALAYLHTRLNFLSPFFPGGPYVCLHCMKNIYCSRLLAPWCMVNYPNRRPRLIEIFN